jgi:hypothetical protein
VEGNVYSVEFLGQEERPNGHRMNNFAVTEIPE